MNKLLIIKMLEYLILKNNIKKKVILLNWGNYDKIINMSFIINNKFEELYVILKKINYIFRGKFRLKIQKSNSKYYLKEWLNHLIEKPLFLRKKHEMGWC